MLYSNNMDDPRILKIKRVSTKTRHFFIGY